jgi:ribosomal protein S12 methylthiotransferase
MPLQHSDRTVLRAMNRPSDPEMTRRLIDRARTKLDNLVMRTTFIVGYPGETEEQFRHLLRFVEEQEFDHVGVFTYSHEEGTAAHGLDDDVPAVLKKQRQAKLMRLQKKIVAAAQASRTGSEIDVMIDGPSPEHELVLQGRTEGQAPDIDAVVYLTDCDPAEYRPGDLIRARIVDSREYDLVAAPIGVAISQI